MGILKTFELLLDLLIGNILIHFPGLEALDSSLPLLSFGRSVFSRCFRQDQAGTPRAPRCRSELVLFSEVSLFLLFFCCTTAAAMALVSRLLFVTSSEGARPRKPFV